MEKLFKGCLEVNKGKLGYFGVRFLEKQLSYLKKMGKHYEIRSLCGASIYLEFINKNKEIEIKFNANNYARENFCVDIYKNDIFLESKYFGKNIQSGVLKIKDIILGNKYTVFFPNTCSWYIEEIKGEIEASCEKTSKRVLILGDSISQGMETLNPSITYVNLLRKIKKWNILNQGVGGMEFESLVLEKMKKFNPELIIVALGTNDVLKNDNIEIKFKEIEEYFEKIKEIYRTQEIVIITPIPILNEKYKENYEKIQQKLKKIGLKNKYKIINGEELIIKNKKFYYDKEIHPNELGFTTMALNLINKL